MRHGETLVGAVVRGTSARMRGVGPHTAQSRLGLKRTLRTGMPGIILDEAPGEGGSFTGAGGAPPRPPAARRSRRAPGPSTPASAHEGPTPGGRRLLEQAAVAGAAARGHGEELAAQARRRRRAPAACRRARGVVGQELGREVVGAVDDHVVAATQRDGVAGVEARRVGRRPRSVGKRRSSARASDSTLSSPTSAVAVQDLAVQVRRVDASSSTTPMRAHAGRRQRRAPPGSRARPRR